MSKDYCIAQYDMEQKNQKCIIDYILGDGNAACKWMLQ